MYLRAYVAYLPAMYTINTDFLCKLYITSTIAFIAKLIEINHYLSKLSGTTKESKLPEDEILDIVEFVVPNK